MFIRNILVITSTWFIILGGRLSSSEWIEIPEFSDNSKVYRNPVQKYDREKIYQGHSNAQKYAFPSSNYNLQQMKITTENPFIKIQPTTLKNEIAIHVPEFMSHDKKSEFIIVSDMKKGDEDDDDDDHHEDGAVSDEDEETTENIINSSEKPSEPPEPDINNKGSLFDYLPVDLFKQVHKTLMQNQRTSIKGKIEFLRSFEHTLLSEIESRLAALATPIRVKRGSGWEDDHVGFPSVEGALLAISFLTFAVYLVQLVMMLFRNLANNPPATNTVLVNRNKRSERSRRSSNPMSEETLRILQYIEEFTINHKSRH